MTPNDTDLLERLRRGEREALATIYDEYSPAIYRYLYRRVSNARIAEDLTGQTFLKLLEAIHKDQLWHTSFKSWLYRIAHNLVVDYYRKHKSKRLVELHEHLEGNQPKLDQTIIQRLDLQRVQYALQYLTEEQAQVIVLRFGEGLSNREVANIMGKSEGAIKALQHRALKALRQLLTEE